MSGLRRRLVFIVGLLISAGAIWFVLQTIDGAEAVRVLGRANPVPLLVIVCVVAVQAIVRAVRWSILLPPRPDGSRVAAVRLLPPMLAGYLGNAVLPARLGEPMRAVIASRRERVGTTEALGSVLLERLIDVATLAVVGFTAALIIGAPAWTVQLLGVAAGVGVLAMTVLITVGLAPMLRFVDRLRLGDRPQVRGIVERFLATMGGRSRRAALVRAAAISVVAWLVDAGSFWLAGQAVGADLPYLAAIVVSAISVLGTAVPSAPGYVGTFELAAAGTATALGVPGSEALALAVVVHVTTLGPVALGGAGSLAWMGTNLGEAAHAAEASTHELDARPGGRKDRTSLTDAGKP